MNIEHLREFSYLAETLSFSITAKHFYLSTSVLSKHIAAIEADLGVRLFERDRRGVELTRSGAIFYKDVAVVLNDYDRALQDVRPDNSPERKALRVGYLRGAARPFLSTFANHISKNCPNIDLELTCMEYAELLVAHRSHVIDVLLDMELDPEADLACDNVRIYTDRIYAVVGKGHPYADRDGLTLADLSGQPFILPDIVAYPGYVERCERIVRAAGSGSVVYRYKDIETLAFRLAEGDCIGFSSGHNADIFRRELVFLPIDGIDTSYDVTARWLRVTDPELIEVAKSAAAASEKSMEGWEAVVGGGE